MKLFSKMLTKKPDPEETVGKIDLEMDVEPLRRRSEPVADDSGTINAASRFASDDEPSAFARPSSASGGEEPEEAAGAGWGNAWSEDDWDDEDDWGDEDLDDEIEEPKAADEKSSLVGDIRDAVGAVAHVAADDEDDEPGLRTPSRPRSRWSDDEEFGRRAMARSQLGSRVDGSEDRLLNEAETQFGDRESSRRRSAMAHLKAAAQATKADRVLKHVVARDPASDPDEQSPYRDDLAKVVRPRSTSRPISRPVSRPAAQAASWDAGKSDPDAAMFAEASDSAFDAEEAALREERLARAPAALSAEDFADDSFFDGDGDAKDVRAAAWSDDDDDAADGWSSRFSSAEDEEGDDDSGFDDEFEDDDDTADGPVASSVVSDVVAEANAPEDAPAVEDEIVRQKIAEMSGGLDRITETTSQEAPPEDFVNVAATLSGRAGRSAGRVKTRLLGFQPEDGAPKDVFEAAKEKSETLPSNQTQFPVGWIVVVEGPGRGACFTMFNGVSNIGRGEDQAVRLDFGDTSISRNNHAAVAYDDELGKFFLGHGGKSNLVRINGRPVLSTEEMTTGDSIRIGETTLKFIALCNEDFTWQGTEDKTEGADA